MARPGGSRSFFHIAALLLVLLMASAGFGMAAPLSAQSLEGTPGVSSPTVAASPSAVLPSATTVPTRTPEPTPTQVATLTPATATVAATAAPSVMATAPASPSPSVAPIGSPTATVAATVLAATATVAPNNTATATATIATAAATPTPTPLTATPTAVTPTATPTAATPTALATPAPAPAAQRSTALLAAADPSAYATAVQADNPVAWWRLDEAGGTVANDSAGSGSVSDDGSYVGGYELDQGGGLLADTDAAPIFNGSTGYVSIPPSADIDLAGSDSFTVETWIKPRVEHYGFFFSKEGAAPGSFNLSLHTLGNKIYYRANAAGSAWDSGSSSASYAPSKWTHVALAKSGSTLRLYLDGRLDSTWPLSGTTASAALGADALALGRTNLDGGVVYFDGQIDDTAIYRQALSAAQVQAHYQAAISGFALQFDGVDDHVRLPLVRFSHTTAYTMEAWVKPAKATAQTLIASMYEAVEWTQSTHYLRINDAGRFQHYLRDGGTEKTVTGATVVVPGNWYHVAGVAQDNGTMRLYVNGVEEGTPVAVADIGLPWDYWWYQTIGREGGNYAWDSGYFQGAMDEIRLWDGVRTPEQIAASAGLRLWGTEAGLLGLLRLDEGSGTTAGDSTPADGHNGTLTNGPLWVVSQAPLAIPDNAPPAAASDSYTVTEDSGLAVAAPGVLSNDTDPDGDTVAAVRVAGPSHGSLTLSPDGSFSYTPAANYSGPDSFTYRAGDGSLDSLAATVSITVSPVNDPPVAADDTFSSIVEESSTVYSGPWGVLRNDSDPDGDLLTVVLLASPNGDVTLGSDGGFTYRPAGNFFGTATFTYRACDPSGACDEATAHIPVSPRNDAPQAHEDWYSTPEDTTLTVAAPGVLGNDVEVDGETMTASAGGAWHGDLTLNANGSFTYTPEPNYSGRDSFFYTAWDASNTPSSGFTIGWIDVAPVNDAPVAGNGALAVDEDTTGTGTLAATDIDSGSLTRSVVTAASHGTVTITNPATGAYSYTPVPNYNGPDSFTFRANDGSLDSNTATVSITVWAVNDAPDAVDDVATVAEDSGTSIINVLANDSNGPDTGETRTVTAVTQGIHGSVTLTAGVVRYAPGANYFGPDTFTYTISDANGGIDTATVGVTVVPVNDPPMAMPDSYFTVEDIELAVPAPGVLGNDINVDGDLLAAVLVSGPSHGTLTLNANGSFDYTPAANFNGSDSFAYRADDGSLYSNTITVSITVAPMNDMPTDIALSHNSVAENLPSSTLVGAFSSTDVDSAGFIYSLVAGAGDTDNSSFAISGTSLRTGAAFDFETRNVYSVRVRTTDQGGLSFEEAFTIAVADVNEAPVAMADSFSTGEDAALSVSAPGILGNDNDVDGDLLTAMLVSGPSHGTLTLNPDGSFIYTPAAHYNGPDSFTYRVRDDGAPSLESEAATVGITVTAVNDTPVFSPGSDQGIAPLVLEDCGAQVVAGWATGIGPGGGPDEADQALSFQVVSNSNPALFSSGPAVSAGGTLSYAPAADAFGSATIGLKLADVESESPVASFTITVTPVNDAPSFRLAASSLTVAEGQYPRNYPEWALEIFSGPANETGQGVNFLVSNDRPDLFLVQPAISPEGILTFNPAVWGTANVSVSLRDTGGTANGGADSSGSLSLTLTMVKGAVVETPPKYDFLTDVQSVRPPLAQVSAPASLPAGIAPVSANGMITQVSGIGTGVISHGDLETIVSNPDGGTLYVRQQLGVPVPEGAPLPQGIHLLRTLEIEVHNADGAKNTTTRVAVSFPLHASDLAGLPRDGEGPDLSRLGLLRVRADGSVEVIPLFWVKNPTPAPEGWLVASFTPASTYMLAVLPALSQPAAPAAARLVPGDSRYFPETGYRINLEPFADYFARRGGVRTFGYPISREFTLDGFTVQLFQRGMLQLLPGGAVATMNLLDEGLLPYSRINSSQFPEAEVGMRQAAPGPADPDYAAKALAFIRANVPDEWEGVRVGFREAYQGTVGYTDAFPTGGGDEALLPLLNLEIWGLPTSRPMRDPANGNFIYQRFQRGILHHDATTGATQGILLGDYLKSVITGVSLPADLGAQARESRLYCQYDPSRADGLARPVAVSGSSLAGAFVQESLEPR